MQLLHHAGYDIFRGLSADGLRRRRYTMTKLLRGVLALLALEIIALPQSWAAADTSSILSRYPRLQAQSDGKGLFAHVRSGGKDRDQEMIPAWSKNPYIAGSQLSYSWKELEPSPGQYRWDMIEKDLEPWAQAGKKCWIEFQTASKRAKGENTSKGAPDWIYAKDSKGGVPFVEVTGETARYPVYWSPRYQELWGKFIQEFGKKFDGDPRIEFVSTGGYSSGSEPNLSAWDTKALEPQWNKAGFDGFTASGIYLTKGIMPVMSLFRDALQNTQRAQVIHVKSEMDLAMNKFAADNKFVLISNGMGGRQANNPETRLNWRERADKLGAKTGYAEWGPSGRQGMSLLEIYQLIIGDDNDPKLKPSSRMSYVPLGRLESGSGKKEKAAAGRRKVKPSGTQPSNGHGNIWRSNCEIRAASFSPVGDPQIPHLAPAGAPADQPQWVTTPPQVKNFTAISSFWKMVPVALSLLLADNAYSKKSSTGTGEGSSKSKQTAKKSSDQDVLAPANGQKDVEYGKGGGKPLLMDVFRPKGSSPGPVPAVVVIHGGGWERGTKSDGEFSGKAALLAENGFLAINIDYRLSEEAGFPAAVEDCKCAVRYLRAHAKEYGINPDKIGAWGASAGGHLSAILGTSGHLRKPPSPPNGK